MNLNLDDEPAWRKLALAVERPYKDDENQHILPLLDIIAGGEQVYEPRHDRETRISNNFARIFLERGGNFFEKEDRGVLEKEDTVQPIERDNGAEVPATEDTKPMTPEMLFKMRMEIMPQLHVALGEMSHARDLLGLLLSSGTADPQSAHALPPGTLTSTTITCRPDISSVQAFNTQLVVGGKDDALRKASQVLKTASEGLARVTSRNAKYWQELLNVRRNNWEMKPAPLPLGSATGKGSDRTTKDIVICYALEEAPPSLQRRAIARISNDLEISSAEIPITFLSRPRTRLRITLDAQSSKTSVVSRSFNTIIAPTERTVTDALRAAQWEITEQEIFSELIKEAGNLPTSEARVSERLIVIEAAQGMELRFELVDSELLDLTLDPPSTSGFEGALCDMIYAALLILLLRSHTFHKAFRLSVTNVMRSLGVVKPPSSPQVLQPILDIIQYQVFCNKLKSTLNRMVQSLRDTGVVAKLRFDPLGESGDQLINSLLGDLKTKASGEAVVRVGNKQTVRFTFSAPSSLLAHLPQATVSITSVPQLCQLLTDEVERGLLMHICQMGEKACQAATSIWFVDDMMSRTVGRWEGNVLNFCVSCSTEFDIKCTAYRLTREGYGGKYAVPVARDYSNRGEHKGGLLGWVTSIVHGTLS